MASFSGLPPHLVEEIVSRLPPESLGRLKCISKSWNTLISGFLNDAEFVAKHLRNVENNPSPSLVFDSSRCSEYRFLTLFGDDGSESHMRGFDGNYSSPSSVLFGDRWFVKYPLITLFDDGDDDGGLEDFYLPRDFEDSPNTKVVHHCHGILCLVLSHGTIMLCNPALKEYRRLPKSKIGVRYRDFTGFGYDSRAKDYKVVRISYSESVTLRAEVYSLQTDSWREIEMKNFGAIYLSTYKTLCWRGVCYWLAFEEDTDGVKILCFDLCNEEFHIMPGPSDIDFYVDIAGFFVWNDSLALFLCSFAPVREAIFELYVMNNSSGVEGACSWTKCEDKVIPPKGILDVFTLWKKDELLMLDSNRRLVSYNLCSKIPRDFHEVPPPRRWVCSYVKSLVSIRRR